MKFFNTAGPVNVNDHYSLDPLSRINLHKLMLLIQQRKYFVLHAPRQTGKTSMLLTLMHKINKEQNYRCLYVNVEPAQVAREDVAAAMKSIVTQFSVHAVEFLDDYFFQHHRAEIEARAGPHSVLFDMLSSWSKSSKKPLILLIDEIDSLVGDSLVSLLRQLRSGYAIRQGSFPQSIILCGVRDVRDYRIHASSEKDPVAGGSVFNIMAESMRMGNFNEAETNALLQQHIDETGQVFTPESRKAIWESSLGQPWLVNALAYELTFKMKDNRNRCVDLGADLVRQACENLILRRETHLDQLSDKLREPRVHRVIAPILAGDSQSINLLDDDIDYVYDLGLIDTKPQLKIANPIYQEVIPRMLTWPIQVSLSQQTQWYISEDTGLIDMPKLLTAFQQFFREHSEHWTQRFQYKEAGAQLLLQAFLQRVINGGGRIDREYGLGRGRTDLLVSLPHRAGVQRIVLELKLYKGTSETAVKNALVQITGYMDRSGTHEGHLVLFDQTDRTWDEKIFSDQTTFGGMLVQVWGM